MTFLSSGKESFYPSGVNAEGRMEGREINADLTLNALKFMGNLCFV